MIRRALVTGGLAALGVSLASSCVAQQRLYALDIKRDVGCGCCHGWAVLMQRTGRFTFTIADTEDMPAHKARLGVPEDLRSCHTAEVEGYVIEGHVPAEDVLRLLSERPAGVRGLAVPDMPLGSPGMEIPSGEREAYEVFAFRADGSRSVFARYAAST